MIPSKQEKPPHTKHHITYFRMPTLPWGAVDCVPIEFISGMIMRFDDESAKSEGEKRKKEKRNQKLAFWHTPQKQKYRLFMHETAITQ